MEKIEYGRRTFSEIKNSIINYIKQNYPDVIYDFSDSSVGSMLIDINAAVGDNLHFSIDKQFQETQLQYAQLRRSLISIAKNYGLRINPRSASVCVVNFTIVVPTLGDDPNPNYLPLLKAGTQVLGNNRIFELRNDVDFSLPTSQYGSYNRRIIPLYDQNNNITSYQVTKSEIVFNGITKIFRKNVNENEAKSFFQLMLPDNDVLEIESVAVLNGVSNLIQPSDSIFYDDETRFYSVDYLAQDTVFVESTSVAENGIVSGNYKKINKKFIYEFTENNNCVLTFGGGDPNVDYYNDFILNQNNLNNDYFLNMYLNNLSTGERIQPNTTIFVKYRVGGGSQSNVGPNTINVVNNQIFTFNGTTLPNVRQTVINSLNVNNQFPAVGGTDTISIESLRNLIKYHNSAQKRCVTVNDYKFMVATMPSKFGRPFRTNVLEENNKVVVSILGINDQGKLDNTSTTLLKRNISEYIENYRMINDYVEVRDGKVINLGLELKLYVQFLSDSEIVNSVANVVSEYFNILNKDMNSDIYIGDLIKNINDVVGVINVIDYKFFNKVGNEYSNNEIAMDYFNNVTREIRLVNNTLFSEPDGMFEIKFPEKDIKIILFRKTDL
jgi:hypothetical protein